MPGVRDRHRFQTFPGRFLCWLFGIQMFERAPCVQAIGELIMTTRRSSTIASITYAGLGCESSLRREIDLADLVTPRTRWALLTEFLANFLRWSRVSSTESGEVTAAWRRVHLHVGRNVADFQRMKGRVAGARDVRRGAFGGKFVGSLTIWRLVWGRFSRSFFISSRKGKAGDR